MWIQIREEPRMSRNVTYASKNWAEIRGIQGLFVQDLYTYRIYIGFIVGIVLQIMKSEILAYAIFHQSIKTENNI